MFYVKKSFEISSMHSLKLDYPSKCANPHGHNWQITVYCRSKELDNNGMVIDFVKIKKLLETLDHTDLNKKFNFNPTAENIAKWIVENLPYCYKAKVEESKNNEAIYEI